jgi:hypothetical protein
MSARDDYPKAHHNTYGASHRGETSRQVQEALDEIDLLRKLNSSLTRSRNGLLADPSVFRAKATVPALDDQARKGDGMLSEIADLHIDVEGLKEESKRAHGLSESFKDLFVQVMEVITGLEKRVANMEEVTL